MPKYKVKVEKTIEARSEEEAIDILLHWMIEEDSNADLTPDSDEVTIDEIK